MATTINNLEIDVLFVDNPGEDILGHFNPEEQKIIIKNGLSKQLKRETLIHELVHAFLWCYGFTDWELNEEGMCNFIGAYADKIVHIANIILK